MNILMLGWEFPPFIAGGLGTACYGLTKALDRLGHHVTFVLPRAVDRSQSSHVQVLSPESVSDLPPSLASAINSPPDSLTARQIRVAQRIKQKLLDLQNIREFTLEGFEHTTFRAVPANLRSPYGKYAGLTDTQITELIHKEREHSLIKEVEAEVDAEYTRLATILNAPEPASLPSFPAAGTPDAPANLGPTPGFLGLGKRGGDYGGDLMGDVRRYAELCVELTRGQRYDVIHAHDWMTFPAGIAVARLTNTPLIAHIHSTEFDRSGMHVNQQVYDIERRGMHSAMRVIAVSHWTRNTVLHRYGVSPETVRVVWNGIELEGRPGASTSGPSQITPSDKIVLFLGRITMQKGPEYFIAAARRVLEKLDNVKFVVAGSGDMATRMIELAASYGIGHKVLFTGFLRGRDVARAFRMADCYVMPSVSEPFGIAPLEAMSHDVPTIISKQSGVSEALTHVLKVDFWDIDEMANKIIAILRHPPLTNTLREHGKFELRRLTWEGAAQKCAEVYAEARAGMRRAG